MTPNEALAQIQYDLARLSFESCGSTSKLSHTRQSTSGSSSQPPKNYGSAQIEAEKILIGCARVIRQRIYGAIDPGENSKGEIKSKIRKAILENTLATPRELAFTFDVHEDTVRRLRKEAKQDDQQRESLTRAPAETLRELATS